MAFNHTFTYNPSFKPKYTIESRIKSLTPTTFPSNCNDRDIKKKLNGHLVKVWRQRWMMWKDDWKDDVELTALFLEAEKLAESNSEELTINAARFNNNSRSNNRSWRQSGRKNSRGYSQNNNVRFCIAKVQVCFLLFSFRIYLFSDTRYRLC